MVAAILQSHADNGRDADKDAVVLVDVELVVSSLRRNNSRNQS
jgi:hypothetical protein